MRYCQNYGAGKCGSENIGTVLQGLKVQEWNLREGMCLQDLNSRAFSTSSILLSVHKFTVS